MTGGIGNRQEQLAQLVGNQFGQFKDADLWERVQGNLLDLETDGIWVDLGLEENVIAPFATEQLLADEMKRGVA